MGVIRILLAIAVVITHTTPLFGQEWLRLTGGLPSVRLFYIISGFYMALILNRKYTGPGSYKLFLSNRLLRLYPTYAAVMVLTLAVVSGIKVLFGIYAQPLTSWLKFGDTMTPGATATMILPQILILGQDVVMFLGIDSAQGEVVYSSTHADGALRSWRFMAIPPAWTLSIELWFYMLAPLMVRRGWKAIAGLAIAFFVLRALLVYGAGLGEPPWGEHFIFGELFLFLLGALGYCVFDRFEKAWKDARWAGPSAFIIALAGVVAYPYLPGNGVLAGVSWFALVFAVTVPPMFAWTKSSAVDRWIGELSYPVYLIHYPVKHVLVAFKSAWIDAHLGILTLLITLALAMLLYAAIDLPIGRWRQARIGKPAPSPRPSPTPEPVPF